MRIFAIFALLFGLSAHGQNACPPPPAAFEQTRARLLQALEDLSGHIRNTQCLVASCDPTGSSDGRCYTSTHEQVIAAQGRFAVKVQKIQNNKNSLKVVLDKYSGAMKTLGSDA